MTGSDLRWACDICLAPSDLEDGGLRFCTDCWDATHQHVQRGSE